MHIPYWVPEWVPRFVRTHLAVRNGTLDYDDTLNELLLILWLRRAEGKPYINKALIRWKLSDMLRAQNRRLRPERFHCEAHTESYDIQRRIDARASLHAIERKVAHLPQQTRDLLRLVSVGHTVRSAGAALDVTLSSAYRDLVLLRDYLRPSCGTYHKMVH